MQKCASTSNPIEKCQYQYYYVSHEHKQATKPLFINEYDITLNLTTLYKGPHSILLSFQNNNFASLSL